MSSKQGKAILTAMGKDRVGIVQDLTEVLTKWECNIEESKMAVLADQFAVILLFAGPQDNVEKLLAGEESWEKVADLQVELKRVAAAEGKRGGLTYLVETVSLDSPGIVHSVTQVLREFKINIEELDTESASAPFTGSPMFVMKLRVILPVDVSPAAVREALHRTASDKDLDIKFEPLSNILPL